MSNILFRLAEQLLTVSRLHSPLVSLRLFSSVFWHFLNVLNDPSYFSIERTNMNNNDDTYDFLFFFSYFLLRATPSRVSDRFRAFRCVPDRFRVFNRARTDIFTGSDVIFVYWRQEFSFRGAKCTGCFYVFFFSVCKRLFDPKSLYDRQRQSWCPVTIIGWPRRTTGDHFLWFFVVQ